MKTRKLTLEISESLFQQLEKLSELKEESIDELAIEIIATNIFNLTKKAQDLNEILTNIPSEKLPEIVQNGELIGVEIF